MEKYHIEELIPQRAPIVMVDKINFCDDKRTTSLFVVKPDNVFCAGKRFLEAGLIENIAQTAAARMGYLARTMGSQPLVGYIGAVKNLNIFFCPDVGSELHTEIIVESEIMGFTLITGKVSVKGEIAAKCEMRVFLFKEA